ncbi:MAG: twitching motility protein PilT [Candidatus Raymondbacteria bacterium RifOxyA12_full_50_37]|uniref:Twitching motility protein PilT n=1 Tax=Candidatus Raymondbacteria bacterium RIFOXYD12_FULL_49_13 TaxID=1817890 RepID=A0A1F7FH66_UNCRA|nr:MAG: twitching motility protein PilT [Candidatus Raymondbacteria bacterium RifOxyA12_full_50_37]OGJ91686.1 MAG: twitching motility protein PilT [Candidatus Raymondbacteria bacterium RIFOXYA2_FULL_49_16]OGJ98697.1 MAG: twitching motility protein PilT [Candidatus Raymondbacteria bacterium RIFOXYC2_FULL_50_21]OGK02187.1 MAG: twitching motility protein PilT [Candidatus Raymondbacteria bacterium RifOxyB12_full_50_8]OGK05806.1 MAG: twitching motility protein PilT [Candidatus Raymondbacteria bacter
MDIVVDTSVIIAVIAEETTKQSVVEATTGKSLLAPPSLTWEIGNAFSAMFKRRKCTIKQAIQALHVFQSIPIRYVPIELEDALELCSTYNIYAYDAYILATSIKHKCPLITLDENLVEIAKKLHIETIEVKL